MFTLAQPFFELYIGLKKQWVCTFIIEYKNKPHNALFLFPLATFVYFLASHKTPSVIIIAAHDRSVN